MPIPFTIEEDIQKSSDDFSHIMSQGDYHVGSKCADSTVKDVLNKIKNTVFLHTFNRDLFHTVCAYNDLHILQPLIIQLLVDDSIISDYILIYSSSKYTFSLLKN